MAVVRFLAWLLSLLPRRVLWWWGVFLGWLWWDVFRFRRFTLYRNITIVFPNLPKEERIRLIRQSLSWLGFVFFETLLIPAIDEKWLKKWVVVEGDHHLRQALDQGKGAFLLSLHLGNGDMAATALPMLGWPLHLITKRFKVKWANDFWFGMREAKGTKLIEPHGSNNAFQILKAIKANEVVVFVIDQFMGRPYGIPTTFFGRPTATAYGLSLFAMKTGAPVVPVWNYHDDDLRIHIAFGEPVEFEHFSDDKDLQMKGMTQKYNSVLEKLILAHPDQWMWVHRRWKHWE